MEKIVIQVRDKDKAKLLYELIKALEFVEFVNTSSEDADELSAEDKTNSFFSMAGIWAGRDIQLDAIRRQAWPRGVS